MCYPVYIDTQKRIQHHTYLYRIIDSKPNAKTCFLSVYWGYLVNFSHSGLLVRSLAWKKIYFGYFFPGKGPHHPTPPPHIYVKKNLGFKNARSASN